MIKYLVAFLAGLVFAAGLVISGMTVPSNVQGFLNIAGIFDAARFGAWLPNLAFVMGGAFMVMALAFKWTPKVLQKPWLHIKFELPTRVDIDARLIIGAALFGCGWGLAGYCPGPALASVLTGGFPMLLFVIAMLAGMWLAKKL